MKKKIDNYIEIVISDTCKDPYSERLQIGVELDTKILKRILSKVYKKVCISKISTLQDLQELISKKPDLVFSGLKYFDIKNQKLWLSNYLDEHNIAYIGSNKRALDNEYNKARAKKLLERKGLLTAPYFTTSPGKHVTENSIPISFPLFIKPITGGGSDGIDSDSVVTDFKGFKKKVASLYKMFHTEILVESYLQGDEYSVGIFENHENGSLDAMPIKIIPKKNKNKDRILDAIVKKENSESVLYVEDSEVRKKISDLAKHAFTTLGAKSYGRIDIKMDINNTPHFLEANLIPGLGFGSGPGKGYFYRSCFLNHNMGYEDMILKIAHTGLRSKIGPHETS